MGTSGFQLWLQSQKAISYPVKNPYNSIPINQNEMGGGGGKEVLGFSSGTLHTNANTSKH
jgi:hypothetical protein